MKSINLTIFTTALLLSSAAAQADVSISKKSTQNMSCDAGVCTATAQKAVLNVSDLQTMLASGDVAVKTGNVTNDINIDQPLTWISTSRLDLDAQQSVVVKKAVTVMGNGALTIITNGGGKKGEFIVIPKHGSVQFWDLSSSLIIDGSSYTLVDDIKTLATDIAGNPSGYYALSKPYDASADGTYSSAPILTDFVGKLQGLGNTISNLSFSDDEQQVDSVGLFSRMYAPAEILNLGLLSVDIEGVSEYGSAIGSLIGDLESGLVDRCWTTLKIQFNAPLHYAPVIGGLVGISGGAVSNSSSEGNIYVSGLVIGNTGGLVGFNAGFVANSFSKMAMEIYEGSYFSLGGLIGKNSGNVTNSYADGSVRDQYADNCCFGELGGLVGQNSSTGTVFSSYTTAHVRAMPRDRICTGGLIGEDDSPAGNIATSYWDIDRGVTDPSKGACNISYDQGIKGLATTQLQRKLPRGFSPAIWGLDPRIRHGQPYLLANPPR